MTTRPGGPDTRMVQYPSLRVGATANEALMDWQNTQTAAGTTAQPITQLTEQAHDISATELVVTTDPNELKKLGFVQPTGKLYGKPPVIGQTGNFPHGIPANMLETEYFKSLTEAEKHRLVRQAVMRHLIPFGVNQANFRKGNGPDKTPLQDGLDVIIFGPATVQLFTGTILPPMTEVAMVPMPANKTGRSGLVKYTSEGVERMPLTVEPLSKQNVINVIRMDLAAFNERVVKRTNPTGKAAGILKASVNPMGRDGAMLEADKNAAAVYAGALGMALVVLDALGLGAVHATLVNAISDDKVAPALAENVISRLCGEKTAAAPSAASSSVAPAAPSPAQTLANTLTKSALATMVGGIQDTAAVNNRSFGRILQSVPSSRGFARAATGVYDYDLLVRM